MQIVCLDDLTTSASAVGQAEFFFSTKLAKKNKLPSEFKRTASRKPAGSSFGIGSKDHFMA